MKELLSFVFITIGLLLDTFSILLVIWVVRRGHGPSPIVGPSLTFYVIGSVLQWQDYGVFYLILLLLYLGITNIFIPILLRPIYWRNHEKLHQNSSKDER
jgi:hypothetical protein